MFSLAASYYITMLSIPDGSPLHAMRVTEANLTLLETAIETYRQAHNAYPDAGERGLNSAVAELSREADYLPGGAPADAWGRPYVYVPFEAYGEPGAEAMKDESGAYAAPGSYQLYSRGLDGISSALPSDANTDNIVSWDRSKPWQARYRHKHKEFVARWRKMTPDERMKKPQ
ncbi:MAG: hypothetical protein AMXMBFR84_31520 [Candidatus Hydrogenedentota bacterium]